MSITVRLFARLREQLGCDQLVLRKTELFHHGSEMVLARFPNVAADGRWDFLNVDPGGGMLTGFAYSGCDYGGQNCSAERVERLKRWTEEGAAMRLSFDDSWEYEARGYTCQPRIEADHPDRDDLRTA